MGVDFLIFVIPQWIVLKMCVLVHPHSQTLCGAALPDASFPRKYVRDTLILIIIE